MMRVLRYTDFCYTDVILSAGVDGVVRPDVQ